MCILCFSLFFVDLFAGGGGSTAAAVTLDTIADESRKMADGVAMSPSRLSSRDGKICYSKRRLEYDFLACFCALLPTCRFSFFFSLFFFLHRGMFIFFVSLRLCSNLLLSDSTYFIVHVLSACVICTLPRLGIL